MANNDRADGNTGALVGRLGGESAGDLQIHLLGSFRVVNEGVEVPDGAWRLAKARSLVKILALSPGYRRHREELMDLLWPDLPVPAAANNLRYALHVARRTLQTSNAPAEDVLIRQGEFIVLSGSASVWVDADAFERAVDLARGASDPDLHAAAIALFTGEPLLEDRYEDWAITRREALRSTFLALLAEAAGLAEERDDHQAAIAWSERAVGMDPANEGAHTRLMRLYALTGRRADALRQYRILETALRQELDASPEATTRQLHADIVAHQFPARGDAGPGAGDETHKPGHQPASLPRYLTSLVGRQRDISAVTELLKAHRLVTLAGIGGVGKTRLAVVLAGELEDSFADGIWPVDLSRVSDPRLTWPVIAAALGLRDDLDLRDAPGLAGFSAKDLLLILDNCEHLSETVAGIAQALLSAGADLRILATSREVLHVPGEIVWNVQPLSLPDPGQGQSVSELRDTEAVGLFLDRLRLRQPDFMLTTEAAPHITEICRRLDGLPLAIEMAAARAAALSLPDLAARLSNAGGLLAHSDRDPPKRHETLRAMLDWSYDLLQVEEQAVFARLSVFPGGWTLEAAESIVADAGIEQHGVLDTLLELVDKSLVVREGDALAAWYRYLAPVRQYAAERLERSGAAEAIRRRHAERFLELAETAVPGLRGPHQAAWMDRLEHEHDNLRAALAWSLSADTALALRLAVTMGRFWYMRGHLREGRDALSAVLAAAPASESKLRAEALYHSGILADESGDYAAAIDLLRQGLALFRQHGDPVRIASALNSLGVVSRARGDLDSARQLLEESLAIRRELGQPDFIAPALGNLALVEWSLGDLDRAGELLEETLALDREAGDEWGIAIGTANLGRIAWERGSYPRSRDLFAEGLRLADRVGDRGAVAEGLEGLAGALAALGSPAEAARLRGAAEALRESLDLPIPAPERPLYERMVAAGRGAADKQTFTAAWRAGRQLSSAQAVDRALVSAEQATTAPADQQPLEALTARQIEIAHLIARDLTNQQIAEQLGIAHRTVDTHVSNILQKLGCTSRIEVVEQLQG